jgi:predicted ATP-binding protein involved in virulence
MRIKTLNLLDFRGFGTCTLSLDRPLTVLIGVNGAGKTSTLDAIIRVLGITNRLRGGHRKLLVEADIRHGATSCQIEISGEAYGEAFQSKIQLQRDGRPRITTDLSRVTETGESLLRPLPAVFYSASRTVPDRRYELDRRVVYPRPLELEALESSHRLPLRAHVNFQDFFEWFRFREDLENEFRTQGNLQHEDRMLKAVREAIRRVVPGISRLRVQRLASRFVAEKNGVEYELDQLSDGERGLLGIVGDIAFRLATDNPDPADPLQGQALVMIDEIEQHLHPSWQRLVLASLQNAFPNCQFLVTTHSPQILSEVTNDSVIMVEDFQFFRPAAPTEGRDTNSILWEVLRVAPRPREVVDELSAITTLLDEGLQDRARERLDLLAQSLTERDPDVVRLRGLLDFVERIDASDNEGA